VQGGGVVLAEQGADLVGDLLAAPDGVLLGAGQHRDGLGEFAVGGQRPVGVPVGAQDVRQDESVAGVGLLAADAVAVAVAGGGERVDREDLAAAGAQGGNEQAVAGLDGHGYRVVRAVAVFGQEVQELVVAGRVVADAGFGELGAGVVDDGEVVVAFRPVDAAEHGQAVLSRSVHLCRSRAHAGHAAP
jgi:hypothetical protein